MSHKLELGFHKNTAPTSSQPEMLVSAKMAPA